MIAYDARMLGRLVGIAVLGIACKREPEAAAVNCETLLTVADVAKACGSHPVIEKSAGEGLTTKLLDQQLQHVCYRDIVFGGDYDRHIGFVVNRVTPASAPAEIVASNRQLLSHHPMRDIDGQAYLVSIASDRPTKELLGARGPLLYKLTAFGRASKPWSCSDDGMIELGRLIATRVAALE